jgi:hypothetical protein
MTTPLLLENLVPKDIVSITLDSSRILRIIVKHPILNAELDYKCGQYLLDQQKELEKIHGKCLGLIIDISNYNRLDCVNFFGITIPSPETRKLHSQVFNDPELKRIAFCKKNASRMVEMSVRMVAAAQAKDVRLFSDFEKAIKWLEEGVQLGLGLLQDV